LQLYNSRPQASFYDLWTRHIATYLGKHVPGNPSVTVQNMPGAGSVIAANYIYNVTKPDGLTLGSSNPGIYMDQLIGRKEVQYDWSKFSWLGTPEQTESVVFFRGDSPYKTIDDLRKATEPPRCGSTGTASTTYHIPKLIEEVFGVKFTIITGYQGAAGCSVGLSPSRRFLAASLISAGLRRALLVRLCRPAGSEILCWRKHQRFTT
jgi:tripartite-type tricarboxylate transporter receptor subunit TctC